MGGQLRVFRDSRMAYQLAQQVKAPKLNFLKTILPNTSPALRPFATFATFAPLR